MRLPQILQHFDSLAACVADSNISLMSIIRLRDGGEMQSISQIIAASFRLGFGKKKPNDRTFYL